MLSFCASTFKLDERLHYDFYLMHCLCLYKQLLWFYDENLLGYFVLLSLIVKNVQNLNLK